MRTTNIQSLQYHRNAVERELEKLNELQQDRETDRQRISIGDGCPIGIGNVFGATNACESRSVTGCSCGLL